MNATSPVLAPPRPVLAPRPGPNRPSRYPLLANVGLCLLLLTIVASWFLKAPPPPELMPGFILMGLTTIVLALMSLLRPPARSSDGRWWVFGICLVSIVYGMFYTFDGILVSVFYCRVAAQFLSNLSLLSLGGSYGMLPALRHVRTAFFYRIVRHPVYGFYMIADLLTVLLAPSPWNAGVACVGALAFYLRATLEERVLQNDPGYQDYMHAVRWRFFPGVV